MYNTKVKEEIEDMFNNRIANHEDNIWWYKRQMETSDNYSMVAFQEQIRQEEIQIVRLNELLNRALQILNDNLKEN
jgi:hypothetical protein